MAIRLDRFGGRARLILVHSALVIMFGVTCLHAQTLPPPKNFPERVDNFPERLDEAAVALGNEPKLKGVLLERRRALTEFVVGNMLFVAIHEVGHGVIAEMNLPVLGREEDAADSFAIITGLKIGNDFSHRVLVEAAKGWFLTDLRDDQTIGSLAYYDEHGLDKQRAYQIVCLMVGSDRTKFKVLADETKLPEDRQETCPRDYREALWSWETLLKPHRRSSDQAKVKYEVKYGEGEGDLAVFARTFRSIQFLEAVAEHLAETFVWSNPISLEMRSCGEVNAYWSIADRKLNICYEMVEEFAQLYRDFGQKAIPDARGSGLKKSSKHK